jgi:hypothetical protein
MNIQLIETNAVMESIQQGKHLVCVNFREEQYLDCKTMTIQTLQEKMEDSSCLFFSVE